MQLKCHDCGQPLTAQTSYTARQAGKDVKVCRDDLHKRVMRQMKSNPKETYAYSRPAVRK